MGRTLQGYKRLFDDLKTKSARPLYFLYGPEEFVKKEFVAELLKVALDETNRAFNLDIIHGDEFDADLFYDRVSSFPLFNERRVLVVKKFEKLSTSNKDFVLEHSAKAPDSLTIVIESSSEKLDTVRMKNADKVASARGLSHRFDHLDDEETIQRVKSRLHKEGLGIEPLALEILVTSVGTHLMDVLNELDKLVLAVPEGVDVITKDTVADVVGRYRVENLFAFLDEMGTIDSRRMLLKVNRVIDGGEEPVFVLAMLIRRVLQLLEIQTAYESGRARSPKALVEQLAGTTSPYFVGKLLQQSKRIGREALHLYLLNLRWADTKLKSTALAPRTLIETAILATDQGKTLALPAI